MPEPAQERSQHSAFEDTRPRSQSDGEHQRADSSALQPIKVAKLCQFATSAGEPLPLGVTETCDGLNFAVFSRHASGISLLFFNAMDDEPFASIPLDPLRNRTGDVWHIGLSRDLKGKSYGLSVDGPWTPEQGHRFDRGAVLLDPYAIALIGSAEWDVEASLSLSTANARACSARGLVIDHQFDWQDDRRPNHPWSKTIIYEAHVRGLTMHPSSGARHRGCYFGLIEKIPYLRDLGVTAVELMPIQEFRQWRDWTTHQDAFAQLLGLQPRGAVCAEGELCRNEERRRSPVRIQNDDARIAQGWDRGYSRRRL